MSNWRIRSLSLLTGYAGADIVMQWSRNVKQGRPFCAFTCDKSVYWLLWSLKECPDYRRAHEKNYSIHFSIFKAKIAHKFKLNYTLQNQFL